MASTTVVGATMPPPFAATTAHPGQRLASADRLASLADQQFVLSLPTVTQVPPVIGNVIGEQDCETP